MNTLISKLARASQVVGALQPDKENLAQNYKYISADKILSRCGDALAAAGIVVSPSIADDSTAEVSYTDSYGKTKTRYDAVVHFTMLVSDGESELSSAWVGRGSDFSVPDKAHYKAITSGHKYFLAKLLNVGVGNEDGEHDVVEEARPQVQERQALRPAPVIPRVVTPAPKQPVNPFEDDPYRADVEFVKPVAKATPAKDAPGYVYTWQKLSGNEYDLIDWCMKLHRKADSQPCSEAQYGYLVSIMDALTGDNHKYILSLLCQSDVSHENVPSKAAASNLINLLAKTVKEGDNKVANPQYREDLAVMISKLGTALPIPA